MRMRNYIFRNIYTAFALRLLPALLYMYATLLVSSCSNGKSVPEEYDVSKEKVKTFPDYTNITCPPNIAPMNFNVMNAGEACVAELKGIKGSIVTGADNKGKIKFDSENWKKLLEANKGDSIQVRLYVERKGRWTLLEPYHIYVAEEPIDSFLSYRLIEPGYIPYRRLGLFQRNLTDFEVTPIYENNTMSDAKENHCINCHNFQNNGTSRMMFHVRENHAGTVIYDNGKIIKVDLKSDSIPGGASYPAWHPKEPWIVFSSNFTGQSFHTTDPQRVEVVDMASDLVMYDINTNKINYLKQYNPESNTYSLMKTDSVLETFPCWSSDGKTLYYTAAYIPEMAEMNLEERDVFTIENYKDIRYDLMCMDFNKSDMTFGPSKRLTDWTSKDKSASVPKVSPDGRFILYTLADFGQFHIWHKSADLWIHDIAQNRDYPLSEANSNDVDSYHSWSSNGRWIAFSSRRDDGNYTRIYITYIDSEGNSTKAFMLPQEDPEENILLLKSYNVPELTKERMKCTAGEFEKTVYGN